MTHNRVTKLIQLFAVGGERAKSMNAALSSRAVVEEMVWFDSLQVKCSVQGNKSGLFRIEATTRYIYLQGTNTCMIHPPVISSFRIGLSVIYERDKMKKPSSNEEGLR